jgi:hypothetical protein
VCLLLAASMLSLSALAAPCDGSRGETPAPYSVHDSDGDGYLNRAEYEAFYRAFEERHRRAGRPAHRMLRVLRFEHIDADGDECISEQEMVSALQERRQGPGWRWRR